MTDEPLGERLARIETKIDTFLARVEDHEARIRVLEIPTPKWPVPLAAMASVCSAAVAVAALIAR